MNNFIRSERFARLFVIAIDVSMHPSAFTYQLERSELVKNLERDDYRDLDNYLVGDNFKKITGLNNVNDNSFNKLNDAFWCGYVYYHLFQHFRYSFAYLFLVLPFDELLNMYHPYHEADISKMYQVFSERESNVLLLKALLNRYSMKAVELAKKTQIPYDTIRKYLNSNDKLRNANNHNIYLIAKAFNVPYTIFQKNI